MSDEFAVMNWANLLQVDDPVTIYERRRYPVCGRLIGETNFVRATVINVTDGFSEMPSRVRRVRAPIDDRPLRSVKPLPHHPVLKSWHWKPGRNRPQSTARHVTEAIYIGTDTRYVVHLSSGEALVPECRTLAWSCMAR